MYYKESYFRPNPIEGIEPSEVSKSRTNIGRDGSATSL
nr:MAG TPA: hypothetical protein [Caudoviricetes sp.]